jgi:DNA recombination-dependent growth factor C
MGFANNTVSYVTYRFVDSKWTGEELRKKILDGLTVGRIGAIDVDLGNDQTSGFALFEDPLDTEFTEQTAFYDPLVLFSFRMDKLVVPANTMRLFVRRRIQERLDSTRRQKMPREERDELTAEVKLDLLRKALPSITTVDVVWDLKNAAIRFYSNSNALNEAFLVRFNEHLDMKLQAMNAVGILENRLDDRELEQVWHLLPTSFLLGGPIEIGTRSDDPEPCENDEETENA